MLPHFRKAETPPKFFGSPPPPAPISAAAQRGDHTISFLGADLAVSGDVISKGELRIDAEIEGDITGNQSLERTRAFRATSAPRT
jgi:hypothetical protein